VPVLVTDEGEVVSEARNRLSFERPNTAEEV
jgi:hypothetical protein